MCKFRCVYPATLGSHWIIGYKKEIRTQELIISILLFVGIFLLALVVLEQKSAIRHFSFLTMLWAFLCCIGSGVALAINNIQAKKLSLNGFSPIDILSIRFWLMIGLTFFLAKPEIPTIFNDSLWLPMLIIAVSFIIIPQTIFQYALRELEPLTIAIICPLNPVLVFFFEIFNRELSLMFWSLSGILYLTIISIAGALMQYKKIRLS